MPILVDVDKTLNTQKMYFRDDGMFYVFNSYILLFTSLIGGAVFYYILKHLSYYQSNKEELFFTLALVLSLITICIYRISKRRKIFELSLCKREFVIKALQELNWKMVKNENDYIVADTDSWFRQITIVFGFNKLYIHTLVKTRGGGYWNETLKQEMFLKKLNEVGCC